MGFTSLFAIASLALFAFLSFTYAPFFNASLSTLVRFGGIATTASSPTYIALRRGRIDTSAAPSKLSSILFDLRYQVNKRNIGLDTQAEQPAQLFLQFKKALDLQDRQLVEATLGVKLRHFVPQHAFIIYSKQPATLLQKIEENEAINSLVHWVGKVQPEQKTMLDLRAAKQEAMQMGPAGRSLVIESDARMIDSVEKYKTKSKAGADAYVPILKDFYAMLVDGDAVNDQLVSLWQQQLDSAVATLQRVSSSKLLVHVNDFGKLEDVIDFLKNQEEIIWVEAKLPHGLMNAGGNSIVQSGSEVSDPAQAAIIWKNGITGAGQIVGVGDTGVDHDHCFFVDPNVEVPVDKITQDHRKFVTYIRVTKTVEGKAVSTDDHDGDDGHGTHVSGSIAGNVLSTNANATALRKYNGVAPDAKLAFTDFENTDEYPGALFIPDDLDAGYFPQQYKAGARISSNSWGCSMSALFQCKYDCQCAFSRDTQWGSKGQAVSNSWCYRNLGRRCCELCNSYMSQSQEADKFLHEHEDMVVLFAAGNDGEKSANGTVGSPAVAKNVITVGASINNYDAVMDAINSQDIYEILAMLHWNTEAQCCSYVNPTNPALQHTIRSLCCRSYMREFYTNNKDQFNAQNMASFSSRGMALDGPRFKPDVVAPGQRIQSAHSDGNPKSFQCGTVSPKLDNEAAILSMDGTSMATPITAGATALIRQYYTDGFYPSGVKTPSAAITPSGPLIKATLIHSSQTLPGIVNANGVHPGGLIQDIPKNYPNALAGYGRIRLDRVLKLQQTLFDDSQAFELFVYDRQTFKSNGDTLKLCFAQTGEGSSAKVPVRATLVWYDPPASLTQDGEVDGDMLINNLDLDGYLYSGALDKDVKYEMFYPGNGDHGGDDWNTVEQVRDVIVADGKKVVFVVSSINLEQGPQNFALVVTGPKGFGKLEQCDITPVRPPRGHGSGFSAEVFIYLAVGVFTLFLAVLLGAGCCVVLYRRYKREQSQTLYQNAGTGHVLGGRPLPAAQRGDNVYYARQQQQ